MSLAIEIEADSRENKARPVPIDELTEVKKDGLANEGAHRGQLD